MGQAWALQLWVILLNGHSLPPFAAATVTVRVRLCDPMPHETEHWDQPDQEDTTQSMGQAWVLHSWEPESIGHTLPPKWGATVTDLERDWVPLPQDTVQADHAEKEDTTQSTGQLRSLQACSCVS
jgi:hypothetical protein